MRIRLSILSLVLAVATSAHGQEVRSQASAAANPMAAAIDAVKAEKASRSPHHRKLDTQLAVAVRSAKGDPQASALPVQPEMHPSESVGSASGSYLVEIRADITPQLLQRIAELSGRIVAKSERHGVMTAELSLNAIDSLAQLDEVKRISMSRENILNQSAGPLIPANADGLTAHAVDMARERFGLDGTGVKVGVISGGVDHLTDLQAQGALPEVTVLSDSPGDAEGTAMLEIVHSIAPGAELFFATETPGTVGLLQAIEDLSQAGVDIIVDDVTRPAAYPFQDDEVAVAVKRASDAGILYFTSSGNTGNALNGRASSYEADYRSGTGPVLREGYMDLHLFDDNSWGNTLIANASIVCLFWSDPIGASANDYDLYVYDANLNLVNYSADFQDGNGFPIECVFGVEYTQILVVMRDEGAERRAIHLAVSGGDYQPGMLFTTAGGIRGHQGSAGAFAVAATSAAGQTTPFTPESRVEAFSTDGFRRILFEADGTPITPGDFSLSGGELRRKPDITAADGVATNVPGFESFFGTSAAAPNAAGIAALMLQANRDLTPAQVREIFAETAIDIEAPGIDPNSGYGIVMATAVLQYLLQTKSISTMGPLTGIALATFIVGLGVARSRRRLESVRRSR